MKKDMQSESERNSVEYMSKFGFQDYLTIRTLENTCPLLNEYLKPDMKVLDIGCGPGSITIDVARKIGRGSVIGIDVNEELLNEARNLAKDKGLSNVEFKTGDCYSLDFRDRTFDMVYSHAVFEWLQEPVKALKELERVTRRGGWLIVMVSSFDFTILYPECPEIRRFISALEARKNAPKDVGFFNIFAPHELVSFIAEAGFKNLKISSFTPGIEIAYPGSEYLTYRFETLKNPTTTQWSKVRKYFLDKGLINRDTVDKINAEIEAWYKHPHALFIKPEVAACIQVD